MRTIAHLLPFAALALIATACGQLPVETPVVEVPSPTHSLVAAPLATSAAITATATASPQPISSAAPLADDPSPPSPMEPPSQPPAPGAPTSSALIIPALATTIADATAAASLCRDRGYAGSYRDGDTTVYLLADPPEDPADARQAVARTVCSIVNGRLWIPPGNIRVEKADYSDRQLRDWYVKMGDRVWSVHGLYSTDIDEVANRIRLGVDTDAGRLAIQGHMQALGIPLEAVIIDVRPPAQLDDPPARPAAENGLHLSIEHPGRVAVGLPVRFEVVLDNSGGSRLAVMRNAHFPVDLAIFKPDGTEVWKLIKGGVMTLVGKTDELVPGAEVRFDVEWLQEDNDEITVPAGRYLVRAYMHVSMEGTGRYEPIFLTTAPQEFEIVPE